MKKLLFVLLTTLSFSQDSTNIMLFGNSITELDWQGGYRAYLWYRLDSAGKVINFVGSRETNHASPNTKGFTFPASQWQHEGVTGRTCLTWLSTVSSVVTANLPSIMVVEIGTNDASNGSYSSTTIRNNIGKLFDSIFTVSPSIRIVFSNIPQIYPTGTLFSQAKEDTIVAVNALLPALVASKVSAGKYIKIVDMFTAMNEEGDFTSDGVHPTVAGYYNKMTPLYYTAVKQAIDTVLTQTSKYLMWKR